MLEAADKLDSSLGKDAAAKRPALAAIPRGC